MIIVFIMIDGDGICPGFVCGQASLRDTGDRGNAHPRRFAARGQKILRPAPVEGYGDVSAGIPHILDEYMQSHDRAFGACDDSRSCLLRSEEHTSELQSLMRIPYAVFFFKQHTTLLTTLQDTKHIEYKQ